MCGLEMDNKILFREEFTILVVAAFFMAVVAPPDSFGSLVGMCTRATMIQMYPPNVFAPSILDAKKVVTKRSEVTYFDTNTVFFADVHAHNSTERIRCYIMI